MYFGQEYNIEVIDTMKSTAFVLLTTASVSTCLQTGDFFPLPHDDDDITSDVSSGQLTASPKEDIDTCSLDCNGGKCLDVSLADGAEERICDCTHAYTETTHYAGEFCQYPSTTFCTGVDDPNGRQFCVNGGQCPSERHLPCMCPTGFSGPRCAFQLGVDGLSYRECELDCQNGGTCRKGMNEAFGGDLNHFLSAEEEQRHINYEHCVCPLGFYGMRCEYKATECGSGQHKCFHGSVCVKNDDDKEFGCDCSSTQLKTAGLYCEHVASTDCGEEDSNEYGYRGFCTNGGQCDVDSDGYVQVILRCRKWNRYIGLALMCVTFSTVLPYVPVQRISVAIIVSSECLQTMWIRTRPRPCITAVVFLGFWGSWFLRSQP